MFIAFLRIRHDKYFRSATQHSVRTQFFLRKGDNIKIYYSWSTSPRSLRIMYSIAYKLFRFGVRREVFFFFFVSAMEGRVPRPSTCFPYCMKSNEISGAEIERVEGGFCVHQRLSPLYARSVDLIQFSCFRLNIHETVRRKENIWIRRYKHVANNK